MPDTFTKDWKQIKADFEISTKRKKPSEKVLGVFRKGTGLETAFANLDRAIDKEEMEDGKKALKVASTAADSYQKTLIKTATAEKDKEVQKDISNMMTELFKLVERGEKEVDELKIIPKIKSLSHFAKMMQNPAGERLVAACKKEFSPENITFLQAMVKKDHSVKSYKQFIDEKGTTPVNISSPTRKAFDANNPKDGPWDDAVDEVIQLLNRDTIPRANK